ncbi:hypothetical protein BRD02_04270 [Halobacteriales archaeon QS_8_69_73]|nr:MAG: hypothetical protein BRD02_04270 [Halobacteriales archaeon QS_8_69_73]
MGDPQKSSNERKHEHAEAVEEILDAVDPALEEHAYPVNSEDLSAQYGETVLELPNETESLGSVFDRLEDDEYDSPMAAKEAVLDAVSTTSSDPTTAEADRESRPGTRGAPQEVVDDLESEAVTGSERPGTPPDVRQEAADVETPAGTADDPEADAAEPGDELTSGTTEPDEFAPQDTVEDSDREGDHRTTDSRRSASYVQCYVRHRPADEVAETREHGRRRERCEENQERDGKARVNGCSPPEVGLPLRRSPSPILNEGAGADREPPDTTEVHHRARVGWKRWKNTHQNHENERYRDDSGCYSRPQKPEKKSLPSPRIEPFLGGARRFSFRFRSHIEKKLGSDRTQIFRPYKKPE